MSLAKDRETLGTELAEELEENAPDDVIAPSNDLLSGEPPLETNYIYGNWFC